jgi:hypothetical protein
MLSWENTDSIFENLPINLIWSDSTSSMAQSFSESISSDGGGPGMVCFVESLSLLRLPFEIRLTILLGCPTLPFGILDARTLHCHVDPSLCVKVPKFLKVLDKKNWGVLFRLFIDTMSLALRVDDIRLSQSFPFPFKYAQFAFQFNHKENTTRLDIPDTGEYRSLLYVEQLK